MAEGLGALFLLSALLAVVALLAAFGNGHATGLVLMRSVSAG
ncbi:hypothetical protein [Methylobacterium radiotolerans]|nr:MULTISPECIES: hypothetical protein [Methylobacterium]MDE3748520.1 hypothetical protein [Methylobacterium radiotolerans]PVY88966.1 hypothetical protein C7388_13645 [Methylobacterium organophilum]